MMKTGDIIKIYDGSHSLLYENGKLRESDGLELGAKGPFEVIAMKCRLPSIDSLTNKPVAENNLIARSISEGFIVFTQERFCSLKHKCSICPHCGETLKE